MPANCLDVESWRLFSPKEMKDYLSTLRSKSKKQSRRNKNNKSSSLIFRTHLKPVDIYSYLRARFGEPNGMQTLLRSDDSDNIFHWDYNIKFGNKDIYIVGATRETHFHISEKLEDKDWALLLKALKKDFGRIGQQKSEITKKFEKWVIFQNKFSIIADNCAELHEKIIDSPPFQIHKIRAKNKKLLDKSIKTAKQAAERAADLHGDCLKLRLLTPIMAEAFLNFFILTFCKGEVRNDKELYDAFIRSKIPDRIEMLSNNCNLMIKSIDKSSTSYKNFLRMINKRNDLIHGNMDPERDQIEVVYFEGKRPLLSEAGDHISKFFEQIEKIYDPTDVVADYENTHSFLVDITQCLHPRAQTFFQNVVDDAYPGYELRQKRVTRLFPTHLASANFQGMRYDDELNVSW